MFVANNSNDLHELQQIKAKFKMISGAVIQDSYDLLKSTNLVEAILSIAFPDHY